MYLVIRFSKTRRAQRIKGHTLTFETRHEVDEYLDEQARRLAYYGDDITTKQFHPFDCTEAETIWHVHDDGSWDKYMVIDTDNSNNRQFMI